MDFKVLKWQILRGPLARRLLLKAMFFTLAIVILSFTRIVNYASQTEHFPVFIHNGNMTISVFKELMDKGLLDNEARALSVGEGSVSAVSALRELGISNAFGVERHPIFSLLQKRSVYEVDFEDYYFDFVFSGALDRVTVPALLVLEIERVLRPGGIGAMIVAATNNSGSLIRSATPISLFLKSSNVVYVCGIGSFTLVVFKKRFDNVALFEHYRLPHECPSVLNNKPYMKYIEPLVGQTSGQFQTEVSYLPNVMNVSSRNNLVYVNIGAGELLDIPNYPFRLQDFDVYVVDHNVSSLAFVKKPGITFVYHPELLGDNNSKGVTESNEYFGDEEEFDFVHWFKETIADGDFVVLMMNARAPELKILFELYETGAICHVDELFLRCSDGVDCNCTSLYKGLRNGGVFVHQLLVE